MRLSSETYARAYLSKHRLLEQDVSDIRATKAINDFTDKQDGRVQRREQRGRE
jgi:hypothetical protein